MPTYEYQCTACKRKFEKFQSMTDKPVKKCPKCGKSSVKRLIGGGAGIIFKGSGFYQTDYRPKSYSDAAKKDSGSKDSGSSSGSEGSGGKSECASPKPKKK